MAEMESLGSAGHCICKDRPNDALTEEEKSFMIECDVCHVWFHGVCVSLTPTSAAQVDKFHCSRCEPLCGPSLLRASTNAHRHDQTDPNAASKATQVGTEVFIEELKRRHFASARAIVKQVEGDQLSVDYFIQNGFTAPILIKQPYGLDIQIPALTLPEIAEQVGPNTSIDVIDVHRQEVVSMTLEGFTKAFSTDARVLNCLSLEITGTRLGNAVQAPKVIRDLCWVRNFWPNNESYDQPDAPRVSKYCIMSRAKSYTDFHIDFGGTSVWYHVVSGSKVFYLIPPSTRNLAVFERWNRLSHEGQSETFFPDMTGGDCYKLELCEGETVLLPPGIIHAVYTPEDSLVMGGNFLHSFDIAMQLKLREMEEKMRFPVKYKFPNYEALHWFASKHLLQELKRYVKSEDVMANLKKCPHHLLYGCKSLLKALKAWYEVSAPPETVNAHKLLREFGKVVRTLDRRHKQSKSSNKKRLLDQDDSLTPQPIKLMIPKAKINLTDRDSVRQLMLDRNRQHKQEIADLNDALGSTLLSFGPDGDREDPVKLHIDMRAKRPKKTKVAKNDYFMPKMTEVHQDDDFVYPSLDYSDDDEIDDAKKEKEKDSLWCPKARVKTVGEKRTRMPRDNARKIEVEKGLQLAAERMKDRKRLKKAAKKLDPIKRATGMSSSSTRLDLVPTTSSSRPAQPAKPKKGMATAKQRLGKKLKLKF